MRIAMRTALENRNSNRLSVIPAILIGLLLLCAAPAAHAEGLVDVRITGEPPLPQPISDELRDIFADTLSDVLFAEDVTPEQMSANSSEIAEAIRTGANVLIEPRGYTVAALTLDFAASPVIAEFLVHPVGWTPENPASVVDVDVSLGAGLDSFWIEKFGGRIDENKAMFRDAYRPCLVGLPVYASNRDWALDIVLPALAAADPSPSIFPDFEIQRNVEIGPVATVIITLVPKGDIVELIRPRMYSQTLYNIILDRLRERLLAETDFIEGMPRAEIDAADDEIAAHLEEALERDPLMEQFHAYASVTVVTLPLEPVARVDATVESLSYHLWLETFVDFGNEARDSAEVQSRFGVLLARGLEVFVNLNYFTNDSTLETDLAFGLRPARGTFAAIAYDLEREAPKYFVEQQLDPGLMLRGEIFEDDALNEFGITYHFQQYLSGGVYTNGDNEYWVRAIFTL